MTDTESDSAKAASDVDIVALRPGARIGRHEVLAVLGQGGFGITYRARDSQLNREVAIKEYLPTSLAYRADGTTVLPRSTKVAEDFTWGRDRFVAEGQTLASLHHAPGIVRVFDFLEVNGTAYIVMEMLHGDTLEARIKRDGPLGGEAVERILWTLLDGLEQVHDAGFLHRDIKPGNILLDAHGKPTLIDFGASRAAMAGRTTAMTAIFTPGYAAAEQMTSAKQGPWTDIYALSATLYNAIAGKAPPNAFDRMLDDEYEPLAKLAPAGIAPGIVAGIDAGLAVRASDRPQSIAGWRTLLSMASPGAADATQVASRRTIDPAATVVARTPTIQPTRQPTVPPSPASPDPSPPATAKSRAPLYAGMAAALVLLAAGGGYLALAPSNPAPAPVAAATPQAVVLQDLKVEDLERVLAERRAADAAAAEKKRLEEEAQRKAEADSAAKLAADADLVKAEAARRKAEEELARLKAEIEARRQEAQNEARRAEAEAAQRKAEAEMAALRQAEDEARRKAAAEAEAKRLADEALAKAQAERQKADEEAQKKAAAEAREKAEASARQIAEAEARAKAEADAKSRAEADAAAKRTAEAAEAALRLAVPDRQRVQVALTSLGFDTRGNDGTFGPRSREMIAGWQTARNLPASGFLDGTQHQALLREAAAALQKYDEEQKKKEEEAKAATQFDGTYGGAFNMPLGVRPTTVRVTGTTAAGSVVDPSCGTGTFSLTIAPGGTVSGSGSGFDGGCGRLPLAFRGQIGNGRLQLTLSAPRVANLSTTLTLGAAPPPATTIPAAAAPAPAPPAPATAPAAPPAASTAYDGRWSGMATFASGGGQPLSLTLRNGVGSGTWRNQRCGGDVTYTLTVQADGTYTLVLEGYNPSCQRGTGRHSGTVQGNTVNFTYGQGNTFTLKR
jgi:serine/threonine protein kinase/peptidoglycan hydrolase-like protein with peptidoglycan-binding domain